MNLMMQWQQTNVPHWLFVSEKFPPFQVTSIKIRVLCNGIFSKWLETDVWETVVWVRKDGSSLRHFWKKISDWIFRSLGGAWTPQTPQAHVWCKPLMKKSVRNAAQFFQQATNIFFSEIPRIQSFKLFMILQRRRKWCWHFSKDFFKKFLRASEILDKMTKNGEFLSIFLVYPW